MNENLPPEMILRLHEVERAARRAKRRRRSGGDRWVRPARHVRIGR